MKKKLKVVFWGICFIAMCMLGFHIVRKMQIQQIFNEIYSLERSEGLVFHVNTDEMYSLLNNDLLGKDFPEWIEEDLIVRGVCDYSEEVKGKFVPVINKDSIFPEGLVVMLEEALYNSSNVMDSGNESSYLETLNALGAGEFMLKIDDLYLHFTEIAAYKDQIKWEEEAYDLIHDLYGGPRNGLRCFYIPLADGHDNYVFLYRSGGSNGAVSVRLTELIDNKLVIINEFEAQNDGEGRVILYEGEFYYVFLQYNYNLKEYDGIRIHKLEDDPEAENLLIRYLPEQYIWKKLYFGPVYSLDSETGESIDEYVEKVKEEIMSDSYLDVGTSLHGIKVYYGDEEETTDFVLNPDGPYDTIYKMDIANCNMPVYIWKTEYTPSNIGTSEYLKIRFYLYDPQTDSSVELDRLSEDEWSNGINLVQMWFKEIDEKVYTFRIYHISGYNYMLNIILLERDKVNQLGTYVLLPQSEFVLAEGEVFKYI